MTDRFPGPNPLDELDPPPNSDPMQEKYYEQMRGEYLDVYHQQFLEDPTTTLQAYRALNSITASYANQIRDESQNIEVPFWVAQAIAIGFLNYQDAITEGRTLPFGVAMGLEGTSKGIKPRLVNEMLRMRDLKLTLAVLLKINEGSNTKSAIESAASEYLLSVASVRRIWSENKEFAAERLAQFEADSSPR